MPSFSIDELITPLSSAQIKTKFFQILESVGVKTASWKPGAVVRTQVTAASIILAALSRLQSVIARSSFVEYSSGQWLTLVAFFTYGVERVDATFAAGPVLLTNSGGGVYSFDAGDVTFASPSGATYVNSAAFALGATGSASATVTVGIVGDVAGKVGSAPAATITLATPLPGVTCTNPKALVGLDAESDPALRERCYERLGALSPFGPWDAYTSAARNAQRADGTTVGISRVTLNRDGAGRVFVTVATASGGVVGDAADPTTDLGAVHRSIEQWAVPEAVEAITKSASELPVTVTCEVYAYAAGMSELDVERAIETALAVFMANTPIGGTKLGGSSGMVFRDAIATAMSTAAPGIFHVDMVDPPGDVLLTAEQVAVLDGVPTIAVHLQPAPGALDDLH